MNWQLVFNGIIGVLTVAATIYAVRVGQQGKQADVLQASLASTAASEQADRTQRFAEITHSLDEARKDLVYYKAELDESRAAEQRMEDRLDAIQNEWRIRHRELLERCRDMADVVSKILTNPKLDDAQRSQIREAIRKVRQHIAHDHEEIDDTLGGGGGLRGTG